MKGISRIDSRNTHGWFVRVYRDGKIHSKMFSDGVHGGRQTALERAIEYRDDYEHKNPSKYINSRVRSKPQKNNKTGVIGVSETYSLSKNGRKLPCFSVSWCPRKNFPRSKKFYHHQYASREEALKAAAEFRKAREEEIRQETE